MALPSREELEKRLKTGSTSGGSASSSIRSSGSSSGGLSSLNRDNLAERLGQGKSSIDRLIQTRESQVLQADADRSFGSRFIEELGANTAGLFQGIARGVGSAGATALSPLVNASRGKGFKFEDLQIDPSGNLLGETVFGKQPFSATSEGGDFLSLFGASEETKEKYGLGVGLALGLSDLIPGTPKKSFITSAGKVAAGTSDVSTIARALKKGLQASDQDINTLATTLKGITNRSEAERLIREAVSSPRNSDSINELATTVRDAGVSRDQFLSDLTRGLESPNTRQGLRAQELSSRLARNGLTPEAFFDGVVSRSPLRTSPPADRIARMATRAGDIPTVTLKETTLLKRRIRDLSRGAREGAVAKKGEIATLQKDLIDVVRNGLPVSVRGKFLVALKNANTPRKLSTAVAKAESKIADYAELLQMRKELGTRRSKLAFINKLADLNSTVIRDIKKQLDISKPVRQMDKAELDAVIKEAKNRLTFKAQRGLITREVRDGKIVEKQLPTNPQRISAEELAEIQSSRKLNSAFKVRLKKKLTNLGETLKQPGDLIGILSEEIRKIDTSILSSLRRYELNTRNFTTKGATILESIQKKLRLGSIRGAKISDEDFIALDYAMKNGADDTVMEIAKKYGIESEFKALREYLDDVFLRANEVDLDVNYRKNFFPRSFKQDPATRQAATAYFEREAGDILNEAYVDFQKRMGRPPTDAERWKLLSNLMRGFKQNNISLSKTGSLEKRVLQRVTPETDDFYENSFTALSNYVGSVNNLIEARRFFGKHLDVDLKKIPPEANLDDVLAVQIDKLVAEGKMEAKTALRLRDLLQARFTGGQMNGVLQTWKDVNYLSIMGDVFSAIVQLGDSTFAFYRAGARDALPAFFRSAFRPGSQQFRLRDFGLERIAAEFETPSRLARTVDQVFGVAGLKKMDALGKETFVNGVWNKYQRAARNGDEKFLARARTVLGDEADETIASMRRGEINENVKFLMFNELADFFPITLDEVPVAYLKHPNGRIFYQMKTYTTKLLNIYRREIIQQAKNDPVQAAKNLFRLAGYLIFFNATAEEIKGFLKGEETTLSDKVVDNFMKVIGFNRYTLDQVGQQGIGRTLVEQILPPTQLVDDASKDFMDVFDDEKEGEKWRTTREIPVGGELYYWWFGRGADRIEKETGTSNSSNRRSVTNEARTSSGRTSSERRVVE